MRIPALTTLVFVAAAGPIAAQAAPPPTRWTGAIEASGNLLYGAASQRILASSIVTDRVDEKAELRFELQGSYGDSRRPDSEERDVTVRNYLFRFGADIRPRDRITPFAFGTALSSLQQRIATRVNAGTGAKYTIWRPDSVRSGFAEDASLSVALLAEQTRAMRDPTVPIEEARAAAGTRYRWSVRARYKKLITRHLRFSHTTFYQPTVDDAGEYTLEANTEMAIPVGERVNFTVTHRERIDSEAELRGAPSTRDGQLLFGVRASFR